ncbi:hypothetical protein Q5Y75_07875 [Ruegeria sp. 2205SS24-7]|uniref:hypothetical protein n=1 Tax=Ruegeria discodermiae TaxID=3064389 RepID=UPI00274213AD|nr:hypothetical protein [Ruegeria sp. 2205SS24-7]MDP5217131.1 hypothetical protein [Ruegeria sp. 2205SS24-7]
MNFDKLVEDGISTFSGLLESISLAALEFLMRPSLFAQKLQDGNLEGVGPITFVVVPLAIFMAELVLILHLTKGTNVLVEMSPSFQSLEKGLKSLNPQTILRLCLPFLLLVALFNYIVSIVLRGLGYELVPYAVIQAGMLTLGIFYINCGIASAIYIFFLPRLMPKLRAHGGFFKKKRIPIWYYGISLIPWAIIIKSLHSYLVFVSTSSSAPIWAVVLSWALGLVVFSILGLLAALWLSPMLEMEDKEHSITEPQEDEESSFPKPK